MEIGLKYTAQQIVEYENTAAKYGSGLVEVYATPAMVALMEKAALHAVFPHLPQGHTTVGTEICVKHTKATPMGQEVFAEAELIEIEGRKLIFKVSAWDNEGEIGSGTHTRFIIDSKRFMDKLKR